MPDELTHFDGEGNAIMVDVTGKAITERRATARCRVRTIAHAALDAAIADGLFVAARVAGVQAAKMTPTLIPLCHPLPLAASSVECTRITEGVEVQVTVATSVATGVEMEALTGCTGAALSIVDALRVADPDVTVERLELVEKHGGRSGDWLRDDSQLRTENR